MQQLKPGCIFGDWLLSRSGFPDGKHRLWRAACRVVRIRWGSSLTPGITVKTSESITENN